MTTLTLLMDPLEKLSPKKDSSLAIAEAALHKGWQVKWLTPQDLWLSGDTPHGLCSPLQDIHPHAKTPTLGSAKKQALTETDILLIRQDPPFDLNYLTMTYLMDLLEHKGVLVSNKPSSIRDANEKICTTWFPELCPATLVAQQNEQIQSFIDEHQEVIIKPLNLMGGRGIFKVEINDPNRNSIIETSTQYGTRPIMVQKFLPEISQGDKRILLINGQAVTHTLIRTPNTNDFRGNIAAGSETKVEPITQTDLALCEQIGPTLASKGLTFVGLDVIGNTITEINVTSPTGIREIEANSDEKISEMLLQVLAHQLD